MKKLTKALAFSIESSNYLTLEAPLDFLKWSKTEQDDFINDNVWEPFAGESSEFVFSMIDDASDNMLERLNEGGV